MLNKSATFYYGVIIFFVILTIVFLQTKTVHHSWNEASRLAAIESLVERGTWRIDASPYNDETFDKVVLNGHYVSDKPPIFAAIGALVYGVIHHGLKATFAIKGCPADLFCAYYWLTIFMIGVPTALFVSFYYTALLKQGNSQIWALGLTALFYFGTPIWAYSLALNPHILAAIALFVAFALLFTSPQRNLQVGLAGFFASLATMIDGTALFLSGSIFLITLIYHKRQLVYFITAAVIPAILTLIFNYQITGTLLFAYFFPEGYGYLGSPWGESVAGIRASDNIVLYSIHTFFGEQGLLSSTPLLILAIVGLFSAIKTQPTSTAIKSTIIGLGIFGQIIFVITSTDNFGGSAYSMRHYLPFIPILYFFTIYFVPFISLAITKIWLATISLGLVFISIFSAYQGAVIGAWYYVDPPFSITLNNQVPRLILNTNLALPIPPSKFRNENTPNRNFVEPPITHRLDTNINNDVMLLGYNLEKDQFMPGEMFDITFYWQSLQVVEREYIVFSQLLDQNQTRIGGLDRRLQEGYALNYWYPGEVVTDHRQFLIDEDAPTGTSWLRVGLLEYHQDNFTPLPIVVNEEISQDNSIGIGPFLVGHPQNLIDTSALTPQHPLSIEFGDPPMIALSGYNLIYENDTLQTTLYWQSLSHTTVDWTIFVQLRDASGQILVQKDGPLGSGYYPASLWQPNDIVVDQFTLDVLGISPETANLFVGLYNLQTGERLSLPNNPHNEVLLSDE